MTSERPPEVEEEFVWNIAIGSNMDEAKMRARTGPGRPTIKPLSPPIPATVADWTMSMDLLFVPPTEPCFAGAVPCKGSTMHGILYKLTKYDYETLTITEGCKLPTSLYKEAAVDAVPYPSTAGPEVPTGAVRAVVFSLRFPLETPLCDRRLYPSARYMKMLVEGAKAAKLDPSYTSKLTDMPVAPPVHPRMRGYDRFAVIGLFLLYKSTPIMLFLRHYYRPALAWAYSQRADAIANGNRTQEVANALLMVLIMFPTACVGVLRAGFQRRNLVKIARGEQA